MHLDRRQALHMLTLGALAGVGSSVLSACATGTPSGASLRAAGLLPLSGPSAAIGESMARAVQLAQPQGTADQSFFFVDTLGSPDGASAAAAKAMAAGAQMILGPIFGREVAPVVQAAGRAPVIAFTNDPSLIGSGAFIFGITPSQTVSAIVKYAAGQGIRRIAVVGRQTPWAQGAVAAARIAAGPAGTEIVGVLFRDGGDAASLVGALKAASGGKMPDAVLLPDGVEAVNNFAPQLSKAGTQILGTVQWSGLDLSAADSMKGAWYAAPDPAAFGSFSATYQKLYGAAPGLLAGLAYDAALLAGAVARTGIVGRDAIVASQGNAGVTGNFRFNADGSCIRQLAILSVEPGGIRVVSPVSAA